MLENLNKKQKIVFILIIIFMICIIIYYIYSSLNNINYTSITEENYNELLVDQEDENEDELNISIDKNVTETNEIIIHVSGSIKEEKIVSLPEGSRVNDAIEAVGGVTKEADLTNVNLAYILEDGEKIYIPKKGEEIPNNNSEKTVFSNSTASSFNKTEKININKATQAELETIPGIGPSTALKIVDYRNENGKFKSTQDIKNVPGIGDSKYENMKEYITVK